MVSRPVCMQLTNKGKKISCLKGSIICDDEPMLMIQIFTWEMPAVKLD